MSLDDKVRNACHRIEDLYHETDGKCYVSFSGGKDSTVLLALIKLCEEIYTIPVGGIPAVFSNTGIELGVTYDFVKWVKENYYPNIEMISPAKPFSWVIQNDGKPMLSKLKSHSLHQYRKGTRTKALHGLLFDGVTRSGKAYYRNRIADKDMHVLHDDFRIVASEKCCYWMKKKPFEDYEKEHHTKGAIIGIRSAEGGIRKIETSRRTHFGGKICTVETDHGIRKYPIIDWTDEDVDEFIKQYNVPLSDAYTKYGFKRTGCMACPYAREVDKDLEYLYYHEPNRYKASMFWLKDVYIAQNVELPFDEAYEKEREKEWRLRYEPMRQEMLRKYRPNSRLIKEGEQTTILEFLEEINDDTR